MFAITSVEGPCCVSQRAWKLVCRRAVSEDKDSDSTRQASHSSKCVVRSRLWASVSNPSKAARIERCACLCVILVILTLLSTARAIVRAHGSDGSEPYQLAPQVFQRFQRQTARDSSAE